MEAAAQLFESAWRSERLGADVDRLAGDLRGLIATALPLGTDDPAVVHQWCSALDKDFCDPQAVGFKRTPWCQHVAAALVAAQAHIVAPVWRRALFEAVLADAFGPQRWSQQAQVAPLKEALLTALCEPASEADSWLRGAFLQLVGTHFTGWVRCLADDGTGSSAKGGGGAASTSETAVFLTSHSFRHLADSRRETSRDEAVKGLRVLLPMLTAAAPALPELATLYGCLRPLLNVTELGTLPVKLLGAWEEAAAAGGGAATWDLLVSIIVPPSPVPTPRAAGALLGLLWRRLSLLSEEAAASLLCCLAARVAMTAATGQTEAGSGSAAAAGGSRSSSGSEWELVTEKTAVACVAAAAARRAGVPTPVLAGGAAAASSQPSDAAAVIAGRALRPHQWRHLYAVVSFRTALVAVAGALAPSSARLGQLLGAIVGTSLKEGLAALPLPAVRLNSRLVLESAVRRGLRATLPKLTALQRALVESRLKEVAVSKKDGTKVDAAAAVTEGAVAVGPAAEEAGNASSAEAPATAAEATTEGATSKTKKAKKSKALVVTTVAVAGLTPAGPGEEEGEDDGEGDAGPPLLTGHEAADAASVPSKSKPSNAILEIDAPYAGTIAGGGGPLLSVSAPATAMSCNEVNAVSAAIFRRTAPDVLLRAVIAALQEPLSGDIARELLVAAGAVVPPPPQPVPQSASLPGRLGKLGAVTSKHDTSGAKAGAEAPASLAAARAMCLLGPAELPPSAPAVSPPPHPLVAVVERPTLSIAFEPFLHAVSQTGLSAVEAAAAGQGGGASSPLPPPLVPPSTSTTKHSGLDAVRTEALLTITDANIFNKARALQLLGSLTRFLLFLTRVRASDALATAAAAVSLTLAPATPVASAPAPAAAPATPAAAAAAGGLLRGGLGSSVSGGLLKPAAPPLASPPPKPAAPAPFGGLPRPTTGGIPSMLGGGLPKPASFSSGGLPPALASVLSRAAGASMGSAASALLNKAGVKLPGVGLSATGGLPKPTLAAAPTVAVPVVAAPAAAAAEAPSSPPADAAAPAAAPVPVPAAVASTAEEDTQTTEPPPAKRPKLDTDVPLPAVPPPVVTTVAAAPAPSPTPALTVAEALQGLRLYFEPVDAVKQTVSNAEQAITAAADTKARTTAIRAALRGALASEQSRQVDAFFASHVLSNGGGGASTRSEQRLSVQGVLSSVLGGDAPIVTRCRALLWAAARATGTAVSTLETAVYPEGEAARALQVGVADAAEGSGDGDAVTPSAGGKKKKKAKGKSGKSQGAAAHHQTETAADAAGLESTESNADGAPAAATSEEARATVAEVEAAPAAEADSSVHEPVPAAEAAAEADASAAGLRRSSRVRTVSKTVLFDLAMLREAAVEQAKRRERALDREERKAWEAKLAERRAAAAAAAGEGGVELGEGGEGEGGPLAGRKRDRDLAGDVDWLDAEDSDDDDDAGKDKKKRRGRYRIGADDDDEDWLSSSWRSKRRNKRRARMRSLLGGLSRKPAKAAGVIYRYEAADGTVYTRKAVTKALRGARAYQAQLKQLLQREKRPYVRFLRLRREAPASEGEGGAATATEVGDAAKELRVLPPPPTDAAAVRAHDESSLIAAALPFPKPREPVPEAGLAVDPLVIALLLAPLAASAVMPLTVMLAAGSSSGAAEESFKSSSSDSPSGPAWVAHSLAGGFPSLSSPSTSALGFSADKHGAAVPKRLRTAFKTAATTLLVGPGATAKDRARAKADAKVAAAADASMALCLQALRGCVPPPALASASAMKDD